MFKPLDFNHDGLFVGSWRNNPFFSRYNHVQPFNPPEPVFDLEWEIDHNLLKHQKMLYPVREITLAEYHSESEPNDVCGAVACENDLRYSTYLHPNQPHPEPIEEPEEAIDDIDDSFYDEFDTSGYKPPERVQPKPAARRMQPVLITSKPDRSKIITDYNETEKSKVVQGALPCGCPSFQYFRKFKTIITEDDELICGRTCECGEAFQPH